MAAPAVPTLTTLVSDALEKAGHLSPTPAQQTRGEDRFIEEIKNDIFVNAPRIKSLHVTSVLVLDNGRSRYPTPTDFSSGLTMNRLYGQHVGTAQSGGSGSIVLAVDEDIGATTIIGKNILITANTGKGSMSQCTAYDDTTKVATVTPNFTTAPNGISEYMIVDEVKSLVPKPIWDLDTIEDFPTTQGDPDFFYPLGDADSGEFILFPVPFRSDGVPYSLQRRYYANLMKVDLAGTLMATLYQRWRNTWIQGVYAKQLQFDEDSRANSEMSVYRLFLTELEAREVYGMDLSDLQMKVRNY